jgi:hypothetical protein
VETNKRKTVRLGDLVTEVFDEAARHSTDPREVTRVATQTLKYLMRHARRMSVLPVAPIRMVAP